MQLATETSLDPVRPFTRLGASRSTPDCPALATVSSSRTLAKAQTR